MAMLVSLRMEDGRGGISTDVGQLRDDAVAPPLTEDSPTGRRAWRRFAQAKSNRQGSPRRSACGARHATNRELKKGGSEIEHHGQQPVRAGARRVVPTPPRRAEGGPLSLDEVPHLEQGRGGGRPPGCGPRGLSRIRRLRAGNFRAWIFQYLVNTVFNLNKKTRRSLEIPLTHADVQDLASRDSPAPAPESLQDPSECLEHVSDPVKRAILRLPHAQRAAFLLRSVNDFSYKEIARIMGSPMGTIMSLLSRARERLRAELAEYEWDAVKSTR